MGVPAGVSLGEADRIELRGLRVLGTHGVLAEEQARAQPFEVDLDAYIDTTEAGASDDLSATVDYAAAAVVVSEVVGGARRHFLLESLADTVARRLLAGDGRLQAVAVSVRKLRPPVPWDLASAGVRVVRFREDRRG